MATYFRLLDAGRQFFDDTGAVLNGGKLYTYEAGTTTNKATYQDGAGAAAHTNPIILDSAGRCPDEVWGTTGAYKFKLDDSSDSTIWTRDDITGVNDTAAASASEWIASGLTPTYVSGTQFTFAGDQTTVFHVGRRLKITDSGGTVYATITASSYSDPNTTITVTDSIDSGISAVSYGIVSAVNSSFFAPGSLTNVKASLSADQTGVADGSRDVVEFDQTEYDLGSDFDTGAFAFTAPANGYYLFHVNVQFKTRSVAAGTIKQAYLYRSTGGAYSNYVTLLSERSIAANQSGTANGINATAVGYLDSGDKVRCEIDIDFDGGTGTISSSVELSFFAISRLG